MTRISEDMARRILRTAIDEGRCAEFLEVLWNGGSATIDGMTGRLVLVSGDQLAALMGDA